MSQRFSKILLVACWMAGLLFGISAALSAQDILPLLMHRLYTQPVSIVGLLLKLSFTFLITVLSLLLLKPWLQLLGAAVMAFCFAFWMEAILLSYSSAAALLLCLLLGNFLSAGSLMWFWIRHISIFRPCAWRDFCLCFSLNSFMTLAEYYICNTCIA